MSRNRTSARKAGSAFETLVATYLASQADDRIERRTKNGAHDRGDIAGLRTSGGARIVVECKNCTTTSLPAWLAEAETERINDGALAGVVVHKRRGKTSPGLQLVTMTLADFTALITGARPETDTGV